MRRLTLVAGVCALIGFANRADAQPNPNVMPGQVVGRPLNFNFAPVGQQLPMAAPQAGQSITANAMQRPYDPSRPFDVFKGTGIDPKTVIAPLTAPETKSDVLDKLSDKIREVFRLGQPPSRPPFVPGITRRSRERIDARTWRRD
ncbi:MAG: hypothetical protein L0241_20715 [Planctomycetia bacterium]|nr:hypothetical protein [Planctomycetia bacterium]